MKYKKKEKCERTKMNEISLTTMKKKENMD